jgi:hypothetical protein
MGLIGAFRTALNSPGSRGKLSGQQTAQELEGMR